MENPSNWWDETWSKVTDGLDFVIGDWIGNWSGQNSNQPVQGLGGAPYPERTAPSDLQPTEGGFVVGNNAPTYALGFGLLLLGFVAYKAVK